MGAFREGDVFVMVVKVDVDVDGVVFSRIGPIVCGGICLKEFLTAEGSLSNVWRLSG